MEGVSPTVTDVDLTGSPTSEGGFPSLRNLHLTFKRGQAVCLIDETGESSRSLLDLASQYRSPTSGTDNRQSLAILDLGNVPALPTQSRTFRRTASPVRRTGVAVFLADHAETRTDRALGELNLRPSAVSAPSAKRPLPVALLIDARDLDLGAANFGILREACAFAKRHAIPCVIATMDRRIAFTVADRILVLHGQGIAQDTHPRSVFTSPTHVATIRLLVHEAWHLLPVDLDGLALTAPWLQNRVQLAGPPAHQPVLAALPAFALRIVGQGTVGALAAPVLRHAIGQASQSEITVDYGGTAITLIHPAARDRPRPDTLFLRTDPCEARLFGSDGTLVGMASLR